MAHYIFHKVCPYLVLSCFTNFLASTIWNSPKKLISLASYEFPSGTFLIWQLKRSFLFFRSGQFENPLINVKSYQWLKILPLQFLALIAFLFRHRLSFDFSSALFCKGNNFFLRLKKRVHYYGLLDFLLNERKTSCISGVEIFLATLRIVSKDVDCALQKINVTKW